MNFPDDFYVIDVGMHDGKDSVYYAKRGFKVIAFEANPKLASQAVDNFNKHNLNIEVRNLAISNHGSSADIPFYLNNKSSQWSSVEATLGSRGMDFEVIQVKSCSLFDELESISKCIHYIKIDIEGMDSVALEQVLQLSSLPPYLSIENGSKITIDNLNLRGYNSFKFSNQKYVKFHHVPRNSRHGNFCHFRFEDHSSGCFGEDLIGRWLTYDEALRVNEALWSARRIAPNNLLGESIGWFDLHARRD